MFIVKSDDTGTRRFKRDAGGRQSHTWNSGDQPDIPEISLRDILAKLRRRKLLIAGILGLGLVLTSYFVLRAYPSYTASGQLMITPPQSPVSPASDRHGNTRWDQEAIASEIEVLRSPRLASAVVEELGLHRYAEFNADLRPAPWWRKLDWLPQSWIAFLLQEQEAEPEQEKTAFARLRTVEAFRDRLRVVSIDRSRVIEVSFTSGNRSIAQDSVNALLNTYIAARKAASNDANTTASEWLETRLRKMRERVQASERELALFRATSGLIPGQGGLLPAQQLSELSTQLMMTRAKRAEIEASLQQADRVRDGNMDPGSLPKVLASPFILSLRNEALQLQRRMAELQEQYSERHPRIASLRAEITDTRLKMGLEIERIIQGQRNEAAAIRSREESLLSDIERLEGKIAQLNQSEVRLHELERRAAATRTLYQRFLGQFTQLNEQRGSPATGASIVSYATLPTRPSSKSPIMLLAIGFLGSAATAVGVAAGVTGLDRRLRSQEELERDLSVSAVGMLPQAPRPPGGKNKFPLANCSGAYVEAVRALAIRLGLFDQYSPLKTVLISSAVPGEGKTSLCIALAQLAARMGKSVILVDADFRRPRVHEVLGVSKCPGLAEVLAHKVSLENALCENGISGARYLFAGSRDDELLNRITEENLRELIVNLEEKVDLVLIDSSPLSAVGDTLLFSRMADATLFVVRWAHTRTETAAFALRQLGESGAKVVGAVISRVDVRKHATYSYGDSGYYHGKNKKYYL